VRRRRRRRFGWWWRWVRLGQVELESNVLVEMPLVGLLAYALDDGSCRLDRIDV
jgi:hypothetical protein